MLGVYLINLDGFLDSLQTALVGRFNPVVHVHGEPTIAVKDLQVFANSGGRSQRRGQGGSVRACADSRFVDILRHVLELSKDQEDLECHA